MQQRVLEQDRTVDAYNAQIFRELMADMMENPKNIHRAMRVQSIAKSIERIGDHATNVAEMVVFMVKGEDIRHLGNLESSLERARSARSLVPLPTKLCAEPNGGSLGAKTPAVPGCASGALDRNRLRRFTRWPCES